MMNVVTEKSSIYNTEKNKNEAFRQPTVGKLYLFLFKMVPNLIEIVTALLCDKQT